MEPKTIGDNEHEPVGGDLPSELNCGESDCKSDAFIYKMVGVRKS